MGNYDLNEKISEALAAGFTHAGPLQLSALVFMPEVRDMCRSDRCGSYGKSWRCPPGCGSIEDAAKMVEGYNFGLIVQTVGDMEDDFDYETIRDTQEKHKANFQALADSLRERYGAENVLPMGAGTCSLCPECTYPDAPCRLPEKSIGSMEAYGLWVSRVCELSGVPYNYGRQKIVYTSCYLLR